MGDPDRAASAARSRRRATGRAVPGRTGLESRRADPPVRAQRATGGAAMRAVVHDRYGPPDVLHVAEFERPVPKDDEVLIRVRASTVSQTDTHCRAARPVFWRLFTGLRRPRPAFRTLGVDVAGVIEAVGAGVTRFA